MGFEKKTFVGNGRRRLRKRWSNVEKIEEEKEKIEEKRVRWRRLRKRKRNGERRHY